MNVSPSKSLAAALFTGSILATLAFAGGPQTINYQGYLTFKDVPVNAPSGIPMTFSLYSSANPRNNPVWRENQSKVPVTNGIYSTQLGASISINVPFDVPYWLGVQVDNDDEMKVQPLNSVPYALRAAVAETVPDGAITDAKITGPISSSKIPDLAALPASFAALQTTAAAQQATITQQQTLIQTLQIQMSHINSPPVVTAGYDLHTAPGTMVMLYGKLSDTSPYPYQGLTWSWSIVSKPETSAATLTSTDSLVTVFTPDVAGYYTFNLTVSDGATTVTRSANLSALWGTGRAQLIETDDTGDAQYPQVAIDTAGNAMAVWQQASGTRFTIWANRYTPAAGWSTPQLIDYQNAWNAHLPQVAMDSSGNTIAVWRQSDGNRDNVWANRYTPAAGWGTAQVIETDNSGGADDLHVAMDSSGNAMVVWSQSDGTRTNIWANRYTQATGLWGTALLLETDNTGDAGHPRVAASSTGITMVVWHQFDGTRNNIWARRHTTGNGWGTAQQIETNNTESAQYAQVAMNPAGNAVVVWNQFDGTNFTAWSNSCTSAGTWGAAQQIEIDDLGTYTAELQVAIDASGSAVVVWQRIGSIWTSRYTIASNLWGAAQQIDDAYPGDAFPQVAMDGNGNAIVVWQQGIPTLGDIMINRYTAATGLWGTAAKLAGLEFQNAVSPQVAISPSGYAMAVWYDKHSTPDNIWASTITVGWRAAQLIETDNSGAAGNPQLAMNSSSNAVAVWQQSDGTRTNIWANRYTAAGGWNTAQLIETDNTGNAQKPQVAMDSNGNAVAVWQQSDTARYNIWANRYTPAGGWGTAQLIETDNAGSAQNPQVRMDSTGNAIAVWQQFDAAGDKVWANRYSQATGLWGTPVLIETVATGLSYFPQLAMNSAGNAVAVWQRYDGTRDNIWANRYNQASGLWGTAQLIETDNAGHASSPQVAMDTSGNAVAVWYQNDGLRVNILSNRSTAAGVWGSATLIEADNGTAFNPQVAIDSSGTAVAVWQQYDGSRNNIWSNRSTAAGVWGTAQLLETDNIGNAINPQVTISSSGIAVAVWQQSDGIRDNIWTARYTAAGGWETPLLIDSESGAAANAQVAIGTIGEPLAVWQQTDGTRTNIWSSRRW